MFGPCFVVLYLVSFQVLQQSRWRRESWLLYFSCLLNAMWLLSFFASMGWSAMCDCGISWSYSFSFLSGNETNQLIKLSYNLRLLFAQQFNLNGVSLVVQLWPSFIHL